MALIHYVVTGEGRPPLVFVHGFGCARTDWDNQVAHLSSRHQVIAVDLRGHGASPGIAVECSIEQYGADVADVMRAMALPPAVLIGHSMGCRVVVEAARSAPSHTRGVILIDGSQFAAAMAPVMRERFAAPDGYETFTAGLFKDMFTSSSDRTMAQSVIDRAALLPRPIGEKMLTDMVRYDAGHLAGALAGLGVPVMAVQTTYSNEKRERTSMRMGQSTPYLEMLRAGIPSVRVEIIEDTGHFPQLDESARTNALIDDFLTTLPAD